MVTIVQRPKFKQIATAGTGRGYVYLFGLTEDGRVFEWDGGGKKWIILENTITERVSGVTSDKSI